MNWDCTECGACDWESYGTTDDGYRIYKCRKCGCFDLVYEEE